MKRVTGWVLLSLLIAAPLSAQNVSPMRPMVAPNVNAIQIDYKTQWDQERAKNQALRNENASLRAQLEAWTRKGESQVHAYCETPTLSANSAGARNDCAASGYACEPVSGLCRTTARTSNDCAPGFLMNVDRCVPQPR